MSLPVLAEAAGLTDDELRAIEQGTATMTPSKALPEPQSPSSAAAARAAAAAAAVAAAEKASQEVPRKAAAKLSKWLQAQADVLAPAPQDGGRQAWLGRQATAVLGPLQPLPAAILRVGQQQAAETQGRDEAPSGGQSPQPQGTDASDGTEDPLAGAVNSYRDWQRLLMQVRLSWASLLRLMAVLCCPCLARQLRWDCQLVSLLGHSSACQWAPKLASGPPSLPAPHTT